MVRMNTDQVKFLAERLAAMGPLADKKMSVVVTAAARSLAQKARDRAPVDTGDLKDSISYRVFWGRSARVEANIRYAGFVEYGTAYTRAQPFMRPATDEATPEFYRSAAEAAYEILRYL